MFRFILSPRTWRKLSVAFAVTVLMMGLLPGAHADWAEGDPLPGLETFGLEGALPALEGKVVLVDFWASWCGPCRKSFPAFSTLHESYSDRGLVILAVSVDDKREAMETFLESRTPPFAVVRDAKSTCVADAGIEAMPTSFLVDREGIIRFTHAGYHGEQTDAALKREIELLLKED